MDQKKQNRMNFQFRIPDELHRSWKAHCAKLGDSMTKRLMKLIEADLKEQKQ